MKEIVLLIFEVIKQISKLDISKERTSWSKELLQAKTKEEKKALVEKIGRHLDENND